MTCPKCGTQLQDGARFCGSCGSQLDPAPAPRAAVRQYDRTLFQGSAPAPRKPTGPSPTPSPAAKPAAPATPAPKPLATAETVAAERPPDLSGDLAGRTLNNRYLLKQRIGEGGFGAVYRAEQLQMSRECAMKVLHPRMARDPNVIGRFKREAQAASGLRNAHTVQIYDFDQTPEGIFYLAMELLHGRSLHIEMHGKQLPLPSVVHIIDGLVDSLGEAHAQGIVHRDVKPENIFLETRGADTDFVKVLDFGIAKIISGGGDGAPKGPALTAAGQTLGTLEYMSPEQLMGLALDGRSDLYAVGVLAYELLTGRHPFVSRSSGEMITAHLKTVPEAPSKVAPQRAIPPLVDAIVLRLLEKDRARRYRDAAELQADLKRVEALLASPGARPLAPAPVPAPAPVQAMGGAPFAQPAAPPPQVAVITAPSRPQRGGLSTGMVVLIVGAVALVVVFLVVAVLLLRTASAAEPPPPPPPATLVPPSMTAVLGADFAALRAAAPREQARQLDEIVRPKLTPMGAEPTRLERLAVATADLKQGAGDAQAALFVCDGQINQKKFDAWVAREAVGDGKKLTPAVHKGVRYLHGDEVSYAFLGRRLVGTHLTPLPPVLDRARGEAGEPSLLDGAAAPLLARVGAAGGRAALFGWLAVSDEQRRDAAEALGPDATSVKEVAAALALVPAGGADAKLAARAAGDDAARKVADEARRFIDDARKQPTVSLLGFTPILAAIQVGADGPLATASLHLSKPQFDDLFTRLTGFVATAATEGTTPPPPPPRRDRNR